MWLLFSKVYQSKFANHTKFLSNSLNFKELETNVLMTLLSVCI